MRCSVEQLGGVMGWEKRGPSNKQYFYRSVRLPDGRVGKQYFGQGERARREAARMAEDKAHQAADRAAAQAEQHKTAAALQLSEDLEDLASLLFQATLLAAGFWQGRDYRRWRKRRGDKK